MKDTLTPSNLALFALFVLPGLISMAVYRLRMPARLNDWGSALVQGLFYSSLNYVLLLPAIILIHRNGYSEIHPARYWGAVLLIVFLAPAIWPILLTWVYRQHWINKLIRVPYPTTWDMCSGHVRPNSSCFASRMAASSAGIRARVLRRCTPERG
ncbi:MAG TPA: DUF6338 family protein [Longimicrobium sp.]|jgi:hypothetical protein